MTSQLLRDRVRVDFCDDGIAEVWLCRAESMNALDLPMMAALDDALGLIEKSEVRSVVMAGEGRAFCAGLDTSLFGQADDSSILPELSVRTHGLANLPQHIALGWRELPIPVFAALHGVVLGGGMQIAAGADYRFVAPDARLSILEIKWGLVPDMAAFVTVGSLIRDDHLRELLFTGRMVAAGEAVALGLASKVVDDPLNAARQAARAAAGRSPSALAAGKRLINSINLRNRQELLMAESLEQTKLLAGADHKEAVAAAMAGRAAAFGKRFVKPD